MLVSIVMPSFNQGSYIQSAISSVLSQSYEAIELIVIDGGSTDNTLSILHSIEARDSRLRWIAERDTGPANAINKGFRLARGELIGWLNSDDIYCRGAVERAVNVFQGDSYKVFCYGNAQHIDKDGNEIDCYPSRPNNTVDIPLIDAFNDSCFICQPTVFFKSFIFSSVGFLNEGYQVAFDFEYWLRVFKQYQTRIVFLESTQALSRLHNECITVNQRFAVAQEAMKLLAANFGKAPMHWFQTYIKEQLATDISVFRNGGFSDALRKIEPYLSLSDFEVLKNRYTYLCEM